MSTESLYRTYRKPLFALAYRMLGSVMDAEDIVQEAFLAYEGVADPAAIRQERAFLYKIVTNRCLDLLRSSARKRELYVGPWLPEPLFDDLETAPNDPAGAYMRKESLSMAYLLLLQQLTAVERAVFLLRDIFAYSYEEIADIVDKSAANCRQIYRRAKLGIRPDSDPPPSSAVAESHIRAFVESLLEGNTERLLELVSEKVVFLSDGGGKVQAALLPVEGFERVIALQRGLMAKFEGQFSYDFLPVNGGLGVDIRMAESTGEGLRYVYAFDFQDGRIRAIYVIANPDKLGHLSGGSDSAGAIRANGGGIDTSSIL